MLIFLREPKFPYGQVKLNNASFRQSNADDFYTNLSCYIDSKFQLSLRTNMPINLNEFNLPALVV